MKAILSLIISGALVVSGFGQTRNVLVGTNNAVVQPTNFWSADASNARTGLGLGTAATNPASAFQPSSAVLSNLATGNGVDLTNITATIVGTNIAISNVVGLQSSLDSKLATNGSASDLTNFPANVLQTNSILTAFPSGLLRTNGDAINLTNFPALLLRTNGNGAGLTNLTAANITGTVGLASNVTGTVAVVNGGSGATTAGGARTNFGLGNISTNTFQTTNTAVYINTNLVATNGVVFTTNINGGYFEGNWIQVNDGTNGITFETDAVAAITRTNLGIGAGATNTVGFGKIRLGASLIIEEPVNDAAIITFPYDTDPVVLGADYWNHGSVRQSLGFSTNLSNFWTSASIAAGRTNLGIPLAALTNTNNANFLAAFFGANTNPVLVNSGGAVVSPTNFWQAAPITTTFIESQPNTNFTTNISAARFLHIHSLATNIVNVTNTIVLPTNSLTFEGDMAMVVHKGPTNSLTQVRQAGSTNNLITLSNFNEAVEFTYYNDTWQFLETAAFTAPVYFSGTNASANAAASRTNLGLGGTNTVTFQGLDVRNLLITFTNGAITFEEQSAVDATRTNMSLGKTQQVDFGSVSVNQELLLTNYKVIGNSLEIDFDDGAVNGSLVFFGASNAPQFDASGAATTRTNLGLGLPALTNTTVTNFQKAIFYTNTAPSNIGGNLGTVAAWIDVVASNGVTYKIPVYTNVP